MNLSELLTNLHINYIATLKNVASSYNISISQLLCIISIPYDGIKQSALSRKLSIDISTLSRNLDKLISKQILFKEESIQDKRTHVVKLTELGENLYDDISLKLNESVNEINNFLDYNQIEPLISSITLINWYFSKKNQSNE